MNVSFHVHSIDNRPMTSRNRYPAHPPNGVTKFKSVAGDGASTHTISSATRPQNLVFQPLHVGSSSRCCRRESTPSKASTWIKTESRERFDGKDSPYPTWDPEASSQNTDFDGEYTAEELLDSVLAEFKNVFRDTSRSCVLDDEFEPESSPFERRFLNNLANGDVVIEDELGSDSDELSVNPHLQRKISSSEDRLDVDFENLRLSHDLLDDAVSLNQKHSLETIQQYIAFCTSKFALETLPSEQEFELNYWKAPRNDSIPNHGGRNSIPNWRDNPKTHSWKEDSKSRRMERLRHSFCQHHRMQSDLRQRRPIKGSPILQSRIYETVSRAKQSWLILKALKQARRLRRSLSRLYNPKRRQMNIDILTQDFIVIGDECADSECSCLILYANTS